MLEGWSKRQGKERLKGCSDEKTIELSQEESLELLELENNQTVAKWFLARCKSCYNDTKAK